MHGPPRIVETTVTGRLDEATVGRGRDYFEDGRVLDVEWNERAKSLSGSVTGTRATPYRVLALFTPTSNATTSSILATTCTCPVRQDCKHVAAVLYAAMDDPDALTGIRTGDARDRATDAPQWQARLAPATRGGSPHTRDGMRPLGLQLRVVPPQPTTSYGHGTHAPGLHARPVTMGERGRWVQGGLNWANLAHSHHDAGTPQQRAVMRQIGALHALDFPYLDRDAWVHVERIKAPLLWTVLDQLDALGVAMTTDDREQTVVTLVRDAVDASIDVTADADGLRVSVPVVVDGERVSTDRLGFIGSPAHGVFVWDSGPSATPTHLRLARLAEPVDDSLALLATQPPVRVPAADADTFVTSTLPALRAQHSVVSHDGSFTFPALPHPVLELRLRHFGQARAEVTWGWRYVLSGADPAQAPQVGLWLGRSDDAVVRRDLVAEAEILADMDWLLAAHPLLAAPTASGHRLSSIAVLSGSPMLAFARDALPRLEQDEHVLVTITGEPIQYREADEAPAITVVATERAGNRDWLDLGVTVSVDGEDVPFDELFRALASEQDVLILSSGTYLRLDQPELQHLRRLIEEARSLQEHARDGLGVSRYHVDLWAELTQLGVVDAQVAAWRRALTALAEGGAIPPRALPHTVDATLRAYQVEGFAWLAYLREHGLGGVLADDMGLGKTLQAIALIADERASGAEETGRRAPWVVVAPASVVHNWAAELARFAPSLAVATVAETSAKRGSGLADLARDADVVVVSYTLFRLDFDEFDALDWTGLVLDEAQFVKNHQSKAYACARRLAAPFKLAITGTPMENNLMELWSLLSITSPGLFPSPKRFAEFYQHPIERDGDDERLALLRRRIRPFMLRRTKEDVAADLPPKQEQVLELDLHPKHRKIYETRLQRERQKVLGLLGDMDANRFQIFQSLTMLRQLSLAASLVDDAHAGVPSAKLDALMEMLDDVVAEGHRVLVFSQFTRYLGMARERLDAAGIRYAYLDGRTRDRAKAIDTFRDGDAPVFLISLKAGGFGLNLTEADYVVLLDPWWNPATEAQAVDRAHRIGQSKHVMVYRLVSRETIEEKVMALKAEKAALFAGVMSDAGAGAAGLSADDIRDLLG